MFNEVRNNKIKSVVLISIFIILIAGLGAGLGGLYGSFSLGVGMAVIFASIYAVIAYYSGDSMLLSLSGAKEATKKDYPHLVNVIEGLSVAAGLPAPKAYVIDDTAMNAFATGRDPKHASITVTTGLLKTLNREELEGVIGHEMSHVKNLDVRFMMLTAVMVGIIMLLSDLLLRSFLWGGKGGSNDKKGGEITIILVVIGLVLAVLSPIISQLIQMAISRKREYAADANAAILTRYPPGLANALKKIAKDPDPLVDKANKATAHLFISTPFRKKQSFLTTMFSTHPPIEERIKRLQAM